MRGALATRAGNGLGLDAAMHRPADALEAEADAVDAQAARLRAAREVLERELALRKERWHTGLGLAVPGNSGRGGSGSSSSSSAADPISEVVAATTPLRSGAGAARSSSTPGGGTLAVDGDFAAARAARDVAGQLEGTALARSSQAIGVPAAAALVAHRPDQLWREAESLSEESRKVLEERKRCIARPRDYREGCAGRMQWEADRLKDEAARRRAAVAGQAAAAAQVAREVREARDECDRRAGDLPGGEQQQTEKQEGAGGDPPASREQQRCGPEQRAALSMRLGRLTSWMSAARSWREEWAEREALRCLWERRELPVSAVVARSLEQEPVDEGATEEGEGQGVGAAALDPAVAGPRLRRMLQVCAALRGPAV